MNNKTIILLLFALLLALGYFMTQPEYHWREKYTPNADNPFDTKVIFRMLDNYFEGDSSFVLEHKVAFDLPTLPDAPHSNYVFIGDRMFLDSLDAKTLLRFVELGNTAFISTNVFPNSLNSLLQCLNVEYASFEDIYLNFYHNDLQEADGWPCYDRDKNRKKYKRWTYFEEFQFCSAQESYLVIGYMGTDLVNFIRINHGAGHFYLHAAPLMFSNFHLLEAENAGYAERVFSHLEPGHIYRDQASLTYKSDDPSSSPGNGNRAGTNPLQYILAQESMAWAWYILLGSGLLYLLFYTKRRQRIIPVMEKNENQSLEFITTIGKLHYVNNNHLQLAKEKIKLFKLFIRERYHLSFKIADEDFFETLAIRSEIDIDTIKKMLFFARNVESSHSLTDKALLDLHKAFDNFYKNCK